MQFDSLLALWQMGGHGPFVWSAYAIALVTVLAMVIVPLQRNRRLIAEVRAGERRRATRAASTPEQSAQAQLKEV